MKHSLATGAALATLFLGACNKPNDTAKDQPKQQLVGYPAKDQPKQQLVGYPAKDIKQTPPKEPGREWDKTPGTGDRSGTVKCTTKPVYCDVPQYDSSGRPTGTKKEVCGWQSSGPCGG